MKIIKLLYINIFLLLLMIKTAHASDFEIWKKKFKIKALTEGISSETLNEVIDKTKYLPNVIKYDRFQPEFYEDTYTYISIR